MKYIKKYKVLITIMAFALMLTPEFLGFKLFKSINKVSNAVNETFSDIDDYTIFSGVVISFIIFLGSFGFYCFIKSIEQQKNQNQ